MTTDEARKNFADLLNKAGFQNFEIHITRSGKKIVKMISIDQDNNDK
jgi:hypothetical protein